MKIVHICLCGVVTDGFTYQENLFSKYHKRMGCDVSLITSRWTYSRKGEVVRFEKTDYYNNDGVWMIRLENKPCRSHNSKIKRFIGLYDTLVKEKPDILFVHGPQFLGINDIVRYAKTNPALRLYVDNHADFMNSAKNVLSRVILHKMLWRYCAGKLEPFVRKFYGVLPARVDFLTEVYKLPKHKTELLVMGVDDDLLNEVEQANARDVIRNELALDESVKLIVTGGKINSDRPETLNLMEAVKKLNREDIHLLVFGNVADEYKERFDELCKSPQIHYVGWVNAKQIYEYFQAGDLIAFPGLHSVLWEQAVGSGKACIFRKLDGFTHIDLGGNCAFFEGLSVEDMVNTLCKIMDEGQINDMTRVAFEKGRKYFSYRDIAARCVSD